MPRWIRSVLLCAVLLLVISRANAELCPYDKKSCAATTTCTTIVGGPANYGMGSCGGPYDTVYCYRTVQQYPYQIKSDGTDSAIELARTLCSNIYTSQCADLQIGILQGCPSCTIIFSPISGLMVHPCRN